MTNNKRLNGVGFDSRRPLALYERIILASSNEGDIVLDPFCGYATTPIVAERNNRQRVGMDIWNGAHQMVPDRLESEGLAVPNRRGRGGNRNRLSRSGTYTMNPNHPSAPTTANQQRSRSTTQRAGQCNFCCSGRITDGC